MTATGLIIPAVAVSVTSFTLVLLSQQKRKPLKLTLASILPSSIFLLLFVADYRDVDSGWLILLFGYALFVSSAANIAILIVAMLVRALRR
ncbi:MAG: hypothetical protein AAFN80_14795 [Pseudomonadota bacterium]